MTIDRYRGKKTSIVVPTDLYEVIEKMAVDESRSVSQMMVVLLREAVQSRENQGS
jgi:hypothetical protein